MLPRSASRALFLLLFIAFCHLGVHLALQTPAEESGLPAAGVVVVVVVEETAWPALKCRDLLLQASAPKELTVFHLDRAEWREARTSQGWW